MDRERIGAAIHLDTRPEAVAKGVVHPQVGGLGFVAVVVVGAVQPRGVGLAILFGEVPERRDALAVAVTARGDVRAEVGELPVVLAGPEPRVDENRRRQAVHDPAEHVREVRRHHGQARLVFCLRR